MYIPIWILVAGIIILIWSIWMNFNKSKQIFILKHGFVTMSDLAINKLCEIKSDISGKESDDELLPFIITESLEEIEATVEHLLSEQQKSGVSPYTLKDRAKALNI